MALDAHEPGRRLGDFGKTVSIGVLAHLSHLVERVFAVADLELLARRSLRQALLRPVHALHRIDAGHDVAIGEQQPANLLRREADVRIDPEQMGERFVFQEPEHHLVARPGDQALRMHMQDAFGSEPLGVHHEIEDAHGVVHAHRRNVARRREHHLHREQRGVRQHWLGLRLAGVRVPVRLRPRLLVGLRFRRRLLRPPEAAVAGAAGPVWASPTLMPNKSPLAVHRSEGDVEIDLLRRRRKKPGHVQEPVGLDLGQQRQLRLEHRHARKIEIVAPLGGEDLAEPRGGVGLEGRRAEIAQDGVIAGLVRLIEREQRSRGSG